MRKRYLIWIGMLICLALCGCYAGEDKQSGLESIANTEQIFERDESEDIEIEDITGEELEAEERYTYAGERYTWQDITLIIPAEWEGKYLIQENKDEIRFYQKRRSLWAGCVQ